MGERMTDKPSGIPGELPSEFKLPSEEELRSSVLKQTLLISPESTSLLFATVRQSFPGAGWSHTATDPTSGLQLWQSNFTLTPGKNYAPINLPAYMFALRALPSLFGAQQQSPFTAKVPLYPPGVEPDTDTSWLHIYGRRRIVRARRTLPSKIISLDMPMRGDIYVTGDKGRSLDIKDIFYIRRLLEHFVSDVKKMSKDGGTPLVAPLPVEEKAKELREATSKFDTEKAKLMRAVDALAKARPKDSDSLQAKEVWNANLAKVRAFKEQMVAFQRELDADALRLANYSDIAKSLAEKDMAERLMRYFKMSLPMVAEYSNMLTRFSTLFYLYDWSPAAARVLIDVFPFLKKAVGSSVWLAGKAWKLSSLLFKIGFNMVEASLLVLASSTLLSGLLGGAVAVKFGAKYLTGKFAWLEPLFKDVKFYLITPVLDFLSSSSIGEGAAAGRAMAKEFANQTPLDPDFNSTGLGYLFNESAAGAPPLTAQNIEASKVVATQMSWRDIALSGSRRALDGVLAVGSNPYYFGAAAVGATSLFLVHYLWTRRQEKKSNEEALARMRNALSGLQAEINEEQAESLEDVWRFLNTVSTVEEDVNKEIMQYIDFLLIGNAAETAQTLNMAVASTATMTESTAMETEETQTQTSDQLPALPEAVKTGVPQSTDVAIVLAKVAAPPNVAVETTGENKSNQVPPPPLSSSAVREKRAAAEAFAEQEEKERKKRETSLLSADVVQKDAAPLGFQFVNPVAVAVAADTPLIPFQGAGKGAVFNPGTMTISERVRYLQRKK